MLRRANFFDCFISSAISIYTCIILYSILYPLCRYSDLKDFYVGETIYFDHNKYLDLGIVITSVLLILFVNLYFPVSAPGDMHHCGETYATFLMHDKFNLAYYKDIMLVHGYSDVAFGFIGKYIFLDNTVYGYRLGELLLSNIYFVFISVMLLYIFNSSKIFVVPFLCLVPDLIQFFICSFLLLLKKEIFNKKFTWLILYIIMSYIFMMYRTTIGSFWVLASLPVAVYILYQFLKSVRGGGRKKQYFKNSAFDFITCCIFYNRT